MSEHRFTTAPLVPAAADQAWRLTKLLNDRSRSMQALI
jgi:hypothetical protein